MLGITLSANELRQFQIACTFTLSLAKQCHRRGIEASRTVGAIEPLDAEGMEVVVLLDELRRRYVYSRFLRELVDRSEEHTSELQSLMRISYAVFCLKKKK